VDTGIAHQLKQHAAQSGVRFSQSHHLLFSAAGFKGKAERGIVLVNVGDMY